VRVNAVNGRCFNCFWSEALIDDDLLTMLSAFGSCVHSPLNQSSTSSYVLPVFDLRSALLTVQLLVVCNNHRLMRQSQVATFKPISRFWKCLSAPEFFLR